MKHTLAIALLLLAACSSEEPAPPTTTAAETSQAPAPPSAQQVREMLEKSGELGQHEFTNAAISMPVSGAAMNEVSRDQAKQLAAAGWLSVDPMGDIMLTEKSRNDKRFVLRENGLLDIVPLAKKEIVDVSAVRQGPDGTVDADFSWKWIPNEVGTSFKSGSVFERFSAQQDARASLMWNGSEWALISVTAR